MAASPDDSNVPQVEVLLQPEAEVLEQAAGLLYQGTATEKTIMANVLPRDTLTGTASSQPSGRESTLTAEALARETESRSGWLASSSASSGGLGSGPHGGGWGGLRRLQQKRLAPR